MGKEMTEELVKQSDVLLITGTALVNGTYDDIMIYVKNHGRKHLLYGVTGAGICELMGLDRVCPYSRNQ